MPFRRTRRPAPSPPRFVERASCWPGCALYENGCYAETGALALRWDRISRGLAGRSWSEFCERVAVLRPGCLWRYAQACDLPGYGPRIDGALLEELVAANTGKKVIAFTHKPVLGDDPIAVENRRLIAAAIKKVPTNKTDDLARLAACLAGFLRFGKNHLRRISGGDAITDGQSAKPTVRQAPEAELARDVKG